MINAVKPTTPFFTSSLKEFTFSITGDDAIVTLKCGDEVLLRETYYPVNGTITLYELDVLLSEATRHLLMATVTIDIVEEKDGSQYSTWSSGELTARYCTADIGTTADAFVNSYFLTILLGDKDTAPGRAEYLHAAGDGSDVLHIKAVYYNSADGSVTTVDRPDVTPERTVNGISTFDVSPDLFKDEARGRLLSFTATAGSRTKNFNVRQTDAICSPVLLFTNSFGCQELLYCTGRHQVAPEYERNQAVISGRNLNYSIEETRLFKGDTGILSTAMANWCDDLFRSDEVYLFIDGAPDKEVTITDSKSKRTSERDELPRFTFSYRYAQRNHNVLQLSHAGRIFDNTFDHTFN